MTDTDPVDEWPRYVHGTDPALENANPNATPTGRRNTVGIYLALGIHDTIIQPVTVTRPDIELAGHALHSSDETDRADDTKAGQDPSLAINHEAARTEQTVLGAPHKKDTDSADNTSWNSQVISSASESGTSSGDAHTYDGLSLEYPPLRHLQEDSPQNDGFRKHEEVLHPTSRAGAAQHDIPEDEDEITTLPAGVPSPNIPSWITAPSLSVRRRVDDGYNARANPENIAAPAGRDNVPNPLHNSITKGYGQALPRNPKCYLDIAIGNLRIGGIFVELRADIVPRTS